MSLSHTVKTLISGTPVLLTGGIPGSRAGDERLTIFNLDAPVPSDIGVTSSVFAGGESIPMKYSADGQNVSPPVSFSNIPAAAKSIVLMVEDPDAPLPNPFVHWLVWNIPVTSGALPEGVPATENQSFVQGKNSGLKTGWTGMAPPKGDTPHRYFFEVFALDRTLDLAEGSGRSALVKAMEGAVIAKGQLIGTYER